TRPLTEEQERSQEPEVYPAGGEASEVWQPECQEGSRPATGEGQEGRQEERRSPLFRPAIVQKIEKGADPKSVLCAFFKQNQCTKGDKCKFSHDLSIERKSEKKNIYVDIEMICKYFLDALENSKYGWFWECPNGGDKCHYRHALPPGFVLKKDKKKEDKKDEISIEDLVETQRAALGPNQTRITLETFMQWKKKKIKEQEVLRIKEQDRRHAEFRAGRAVGLSGREVFAFQPELAGEDDMEEGEAAWTTACWRTGPASCKEITLEDLTAQAQEVDGTGTVASTRHWQGGDSS
ncbi:ZC3H15, partial [Cordylochernes scorpioides]